MKIILLCISLGIVVLMSTFVIYKNLNFTNNKETVLHQHTFILDEQKYRIELPQDFTQVDNLQDNNDLLETARFAKALETRTPHMIELSSKLQALTEETQEKRFQNGSHLSFSSTTQTIGSGGTERILMGHLALSNGTKLNITTWAQSEQQLNSNWILDYLVSVELIQ